MRTELAQAKVAIQAAIDGIEAKTHEQCRPEILFLVRAVDLISQKHARRKERRAKAHADCPECHGVGWIVVEQNGVSGAERCGCWRGKQ